MVNTRKLIEYDNNIVFLLFDIFKTATKNDSIDDLKPLLFKLSYIFFMKTTHL